MPQKRDTEYLTNTTAGHNKFYKMEDLGNGTWRASWGKIGGSANTMDYSMSQWDDKYYEKIKKKYVPSNNQSKTAASVPRDITKKAAVPAVPAALNRDHAKKFDIAKQTVLKSKKSATPIDLKLLKNIENYLKTNGQLSASDMMQLNALYKEYK